MHALENEVPASVDRRRGVLVMHNRQEPVEKETSSSFRRPRFREEGFTLSSNFNVLNPLFADPLATVYKNLHRVEVVPALSPRTTDIVV